MNSGTKKLSRRWTAQRTWRREAISAFYCMAPVSPGPSRAPACVARWTNGPAPESWCGVSHYSFSEWVGAGAEWLWTAWEAHLHTDVQGRQLQMGTHSRLFNKSQSSSSHKWPLAVISLSAAQPFASGTAVLWSLPSRRRSTVDGPYVIAFCVRGRNLRALPIALASSLPLLFCSRQLLISLRGIVRDLFAKAFVSPGMCVCLDVLTCTSVDVFKNLSSLPELM